MVFVYDKLDKAADGIYMNRLQLTSSEPSLVIWWQRHIPNNSHSSIFIRTMQPNCMDKFLLNFLRSLKPNFLNLIMCIITYLSYYVKLKC